MFDEIKNVFLLVFTHSKSVNNVFIYYSLSGKIQGSICTFNTSCFERCINEIDLWISNVSTNTSYVVGHCKYTKIQLFPGRVWKSSNRWVRFKCVCKKRCLLLFLITFVFCSSNWHKES